MTAGRRPAQHDAIFEELIRLDPVNGQAWGNLGFAYLMFGRYADAVAAFKNRSRWSRVHPRGTSTWSRPNSLSATPRVRLR